MLGGEGGGGGRIQESEGVGGWVAIGNFTMLSRALQNLTKYKCVRVCVCVWGGGGCKCKDKTHDPFCQLVYMKKSFTINPTEINVNTGIFKHILHDITE